MSHRGLGLDLLLLRLEMLPALDLGGLLLNSLLQRLNCGCRLLETLLQLLRLETLLRLKTLSTMTRIDP